MSRLTRKPVDNEIVPTRRLLADYTVLPVPRTLVERVKGPFGEKRRSISGIVIDTDQFKQTKTRQEDELHIYDAYRADLQNPGRVYS